MRERVEEGEVVDGRYQVRQRVGSGGMADVFCADDLQLGRRIALKLLHARFAEDEAFVERFRREASAAAGLQHQNVVSVYDRGEVDGTSYIAMEFVDGRTLKALVQEEGPLPPRRAIALTEQVLAAARFAHRRGIIHRDLKPHNVIVDGEDRAKVTDFGIAKAGASDMTETGSIMGTAQYLSPEQAQGLPVSAASDLYSIGILLFEQLTGTIPFDGDSAVAIALKQVNDPPPAPSTINPAVPPALDAVVLRALAKEPASRFPDAGSFAEALEEVRLGLADDPVQATGAMPAAAQPVGPAYGAIGLPLAPHAPDGPTQAGAAPAAPGHAAVARDGTGEHYVVGPEQPGPVPPEEEDRRGRWWLAGLGVLLVAVCVVAGLLLLGSSDVAVPTVTGRAQAQAETTLRRRGFDTQAVLRQSERPQGSVIRQSPAGGAQVPQESTITLTVSAGPGEETIPPLVNVARSGAREQLEALGFEVRETRRFDTTVGENRVIETDPPPGQRVERGQTVTVVVSRGPERIEVPSVVGRAEDDARQRLEDAGFAVVIAQQQSSEVAAGVVLAQSPAGSSAAAEGATVTVTVATAPPRRGVPDVVGRSGDSATSTLSGAGFRVRRSEVAVTSADEDGLVQSQTPSGGTQRSDGATVSIAVGRFDGGTEDGGQQDNGTNGGTTTPEPSTTTGEGTTPASPAEPDTGGVG